MTSSSFRVDRPAGFRRISGRSIRLLGGWILGVGGCGLVASQRDELAPWLFMWLVVGMIVAGCKMLTLLNLHSRAALPGWRLFGYLFFWPGMRPQPFLPGCAPAQADRPNLWISGLGNLLVGLLFFGLALLGDAPWWLKAWLGMAGFSFVVHFGLFDLVAAAWRRGGVPVEKLFACPLAAKSLGDFWGQRWNRAFSGFARDLIFRPLARPLGTSGATLAVFVFSGLAHELVISLPAAGGYGLPMLYFLIQGLLVLAENTRVFRQTMRSRPLCAWLWTAGGVLGPVALLFHRPFLEKVMLRFLAALGG
jgi:hypothetical protein